MKHLITFALGVFLSASAVCAADTPPVGKPAGTSPTNGLSNTKKTMRSLQDRHKKVDAVKQQAHEKKQQAQAKTQQAQTDK